MRLEDYCTDLSKYVLVYMQIDRNGFLNVQNMKFYNQRLKLDKKLM